MRRSPILILVTLARDGACAHATHAHVAARASIVIVARHAVIRAVRAACIRHTIAIIGQIALVAARRPTLDASSLGTIVRTVHMLAVAALYSVARRCSRTTHVRLVAHGVGRTCFAFAVAATIFSSN